MGETALITEEYRNLNTQLHEDRDDYGTGGHRFSDMVGGLAAAMGTEDILDYGAGKQTLANALPQYPVKNYDPAVKSINKPPDRAELVVCTDVLEHIEPECLDAVLDDLQRLTKKVAIITVATRLAVKKLADGRNAHLIVENYQWWLPKFWQRFDIDQFQNIGGKEFMLVVRPWEAKE